jgi:dimethylamine monooxygenase subunit A
VTSSALDPKPPPYQPYTWAAADFQLGLRPINPKQWLLMNANFAAIMREKRALLTAHTPKYYRTIPSSLAAQRELRERIVSHLLSDYPGHFSRHGSIITSRADGHQCDLLDDSVEPLLQLSYLIEEDFMLVEESEGAPCISAASNVYSSSGRIVSSVGADIESAHKLVPNLNETLAPRINRVLGSVHTAAPCERFNWQLTPMATLFFPPDNPHEANAEAMHAVADRLRRNPLDAGELLWIRVERQTLSRLPDSKAVAFSLHTFSHPLASIKADSSSVRAMLALVRAYTPERLRYSEMDVVREPIIAWLESAANDSA